MYLYGRFKQITRTLFVMITDNTQKNSLVINISKTINIVPLRKNGPNSNEYDGIP